MAASDASIRAVHENIVSQKLPRNVNAKWTLFTTVPYLKIVEDDDGRTVREGDVAGFVDDFCGDHEGSVLFGLIKLAVPGTHPPAEKCALIEWCDTNAPASIRIDIFLNPSLKLKKLLPGYNVPMEVRSREDLTVDDILQKVGGAAPQGASRAPPPIANKPTIARPTHVAGGGTGFNPLRSGTRTAGAVDQDGWGSDAPPVTRTQLEKVASAYQPTKVDLTQMKNEPSRYNAPVRNDNQGDVVKGGYQPIGKVDIAAIRRQAKDSGSGQDDRPTIVKGAYEPVGKVDIAAIRAKAQGPSGSTSSPSNSTPATSSAVDHNEDAPKSLAERSAAFSQSGRINTMPKPKVANKFGSGSGTFGGTKAPTPAAFGPKPTTAAPVGIASRTFADEGGKTPAQLWAEKKARQGGAPVTSPTGFGTQPIATQASGEGGWKSGYTGKSWAPVQTTQTGKSAGSEISAQRTGQDQEEEETTPQTGGVGAIRDRFKGAAPISMGAPVPSRAVPEPEPDAPSMDMSSKPNAGARGVPIPGLPTRPAVQDDYDGDVPAQQTQDIPPPPRQPRSPSPPTPDEVRSSSPIRVAMPVGRGMPEPVDDEPAPALPTESINRVISEKREIPDEPQVEDHDLGRGAAQNIGGTAAPAAASGGQRAKILFDYEPAEDNEVELREDDFVTNIDMVDDDWWMGTNSRGESGLFPSNYVELINDEPAQAAQPPPPPAPAAAASQGATAEAKYDYEAAEDNELSFPDQAIITNIEFPDEDWWFGHYGGKEGLFPANYVELRE